MNEIHKSFYCETHSLILHFDESSALTGSLRTIPSDSIHQIEGIYTEDDDCVTFSFFISQFETKLLVAFSGTIEKMEKIEIIHLKWLATRIEGSATNNLSTGVMVLSSDPSKINDINTERLNSLPLTELSPLGVFQN
ncbi:MAG: hypothetical protein DI539_09410 [Flavobacterium psychrophilum]|nr:MAG: hypothetical protein DI539_09410 [Flavobacterium psychrophilum]